MISTPLETAAIAPGPKGNQVAPATSAIAPNLLAGTSAFSGALSGALSDRPSTPSPASPQASLPNAIGRDTQAMNESGGAEDLASEDIINLGPNALPFLSPADLAVRDGAPGKNPPPIGNLLPDIAPETPILADPDFVTAAERGPRVAAEDAVNPQKPPNALSVMPTTAPASAPSHVVIDRDITHLPKPSVAPATTTSDKPSETPDFPEVSRTLPKTVEDTPTTGPVSVSNPLPGEGTASVPVKGGDRPEPREKVQPSVVVNSSPDARPTAPPSSQIGRVQNPEAEQLDRLIPNERAAARISAIAPDAARASALSALSVQIDGAGKSKLAQPNKTENFAKPDLAKDASPSSARLPDQGVAERAQKPRRGGDATETKRSVAVATDTSAALQTPSAASSASPQSAQTPAGQLTAPSGASSLVPTANALEPRSETRAGQPIETIVNQITEARETARSVRPELTLRHAEFGAINVRLEASGGDLRATLASRDPGFVPAIQAALSERMVAAASEGAAIRSGDHSSGQRGGQDGSSNSNSNSPSHGQFGGSGGFAEGRYGSSPGSGQASSQPYSGQSEGNETDGRSPDGSGPAVDGLENPAGTGLFA